MDCRMLLTTLGAMLMALQAVADKEKVLLMLVDSLRWDLLGYEFPSLDRMEKSGVRADWTDPVFITVSSPSMMSIATGLYVESHGVVHNQPFDPDTGEISPGYLDGLNSTWWFNGGGQPLWLTAMDQGLTAGTFMYPGGQVPIGGRQPTRWQLSSNPERQRYANLTDRADVIFDWMYGPDDLDVVLFHVEVIDNALHAFGFTALDVAKKEAAKVNTLIEYVLARIEGDKRVKDTLNLIVTGDHGMVETPASKRIFLYDYVNETDIDFIFADFGPVFQIKPKDGALERVYNSLRNAHPAMSVYKKEDFPKRLHYGNNARNLPLVGYVDLTWTALKERRLFLTAADHGFDNDDMRMKSAFYAQGPSFKKSYRAKHFESVSIYPLMCELLGIVPAPNNGSRDSYKDMLASGEGVTPPPPTSGPWGCENGAAAAALGRGLPPSLVLSWLVPFAYSRVNCM